MVVIRKRQVRLKLRFFRLDRCICYMVSCWKWWLWLDVCMCLNILIWCLYWLLSVLLRVWMCLLVIQKIRLVSMVVMVVIMKMWKFRKVIIISELIRVKLVVRDSGRICLKKLMIFLIRFVCVLIWVIGEFLVCFCVIRLELILVQMWVQIWVLYMCWIMFMMMKVSFSVVSQVRFVQFCFISWLMVIFSMSGLVILSIFLIVNSVNVLEICGQNCLKIEL